MSKNSTFSIGIIGQGLIRQHLERRLKALYRIIPLMPEHVYQHVVSCDLIVFCSDVWSPKALQAINKCSLQAGVALLPVFTQFDEAIIGPCVIPQKRGCSACAELRKLGATSLETDRALLYQYLFQDHPPVESQPWFSSFSLETIAGLASREIVSSMQKRDANEEHCTLLTVSLATLECHRHRFLPFPDCPDCGGLTQDSAELAVLALRSRPKKDASTYRISQPVASPEHLLSTYVEPQRGLVASLVMESSDLLPVASSHLVSASGAMTGNGCTLLPQQSKMVSVLEAIERYAGSYPRGKRTVVQASYNQLRKGAQPVLDPTTLGLHSAEQYAQSQQHACRQLQPYHHDLVCHWVWGYSFQERASLLIPEHCAYYSVPASADNPVFIFDVSNGCALGNCVEEAIFHGMLEVVERDAFLLTWYARLQVPRLDLNSLTDPTARMLLTHLEYHSGYTIYAFNTTLDHAVPCVCLLGVDEHNRDETPKAFVAAGSHPHPEQALLKALREFAMFLSFPRQLNDQNRAEARRMLADSSLVQKMDHHPLVYYLPEAFERLHFLYHTPRQQTFQQGFPACYQEEPQHMDLREDLEDLISYYHKQGIDTVVVDQTAPEHRPCGLSCVKVIMPGMLPMTFGQANRRIIDFQRLHQLPLKLGYQDHSLTEEEINPYPHPFF
ncbi:TOMM precursor leader peptide-binding protein [Ktedonospora formicarum]|uniref:YcaO domain-containing protein n=1 Tax=Ktedonospora formicarum TaxID=2778364 RepID=A0A8J3MPS6_9CHLR|nr:TOMM precursor leader peptide-binding protein [Ktedonospora formicarum]GHO41908.1 hypothetical protein KSX_00710 [Ktedonospora formicarum]